MLIYHRGDGMEDNSPRKDVLMRHAEDLRDRSRVGWKRWWTEGRPRSDHSQPSVAAVTSAVKKVGFGDGPGIPG